MCILVHLFSGERVTSGGPPLHVCKQYCTNRARSIYYIFHALRCKLILCESLYLKCKTENVYFTSLVYRFGSISVDTQASRTFDESSAVLLNIHFWNGKRGTSKWMNMTATLSSS